ncbi:MULTISPECIES: hypothetical protein [Pseudomonas]|jgi:hypothetical protein|uniref:Uncharacterized protein n=1 Tax=Pseudomonas koreensis TaxID=198620 RepID=A0AA94ENI7_9PSED|nr:MULTISPECIES: hypothetical protein [Pseudomonas]RVD76826.1 hypothetical protein A9HBioS_3366 [Pseudomonas koreensis]UVL16080.1 hypothetical protein LOY27_09565 [Pseudomonas atacamensis]
MATDREIALEQALVMVIGAAKSRGYDDKDLVDHAVAMLLGNNVLRRVEHPHVDDAIREISGAHAEVLSVMDLKKG